MAYVKHEFESGDTLYAFQLNEMDEQIFANEAAATTNAQSIAQLSEEIGQYKTVTPQMFGAVADGVTDDTEAVQTALDTGNIIYFPPGRYKVTSQLTCTRSCKIMMCKPYPITYAADYPLTEADNWMGSRIETYTSDEYGLLVGDGVQIDGLYMRAMQGFTGVLFKVDGRLGSRTYPSQIRLSHMQLDCAWYNINPVSMFDFAPYESYFAVLDDITIGSLRGRQICDYGFRTILDGGNGWANSMRINNLCIDILADYPLYLDGSGIDLCNWVFENMSIQAYPYRPDLEEYMYREGHVNVITLKNVQEPVFMGCFIWDLHRATVLNDIIHVENTEEILCVGCGKEFDSVETEMNRKLKDAADSLNIKTLTMGVSSVDETGANRLTLSDGNTEKTVDIPAATASEEQISNGVTKWFDTNARPKEQVGRNKYNPLNIDTINGYIEDDGRIAYVAGMTCTHFIEASQGAVVGISKAGWDIAVYHINCFDADKNYIGRMANFANAAPKTITVANTAYIRVVYTDATAAYVDRASAKIMITVNDPVPTTADSRMYEPYKVTYVGGLGDIVMLTSPDGTQYRLSVTNEGTVVATAVNSDDGPEEDIITDVVWNMSGRTAVGAGYYTPDKARPIEYGTYVIGVSYLGLWNGNTGTTVALDGEDFTVTTAQSGMGIGVPLELSPLSTYIISLDTDARATANISYYNEYGVYQESEVILPENSAAGSYARKFIVKPHKYLVLQFAANREAPAKFSNIKIEYVPN